MGQQDQPFNKVKVLGNQKNISPEENLLAKKSTRSVLTLGHR